MSVKIVMPFMVAIALMQCTNKQTNIEGPIGEAPLELPSTEDKVESSASPEEETVEILTYDSTSAEMKHAKKRLDYYMDVMARFWSGREGTFVGGYSRYYEHSKELVSYFSSDQFQMIETEDAIYEEYDNFDYYLFRNDTLVASRTIDDTERDPQSGNSAYSETIHIHENGIFVSGDVGSAGEIKNIQFEKRSPVSILTLLNYSNLFAKFDPRLPEQEPLGDEPEEQRLLREAREDSIRQLSHVSFEGINLSKLPTPITVWADVTHINLRSNNFSVFPIELKQIPQLNSLDLSGNKLSSIPQEISEFKNLFELYLDDNNLTSLPKEIRKIEYLRYLSLANNKFSRETKMEILGWFRNTNCVVSFDVVDEN